MAVTPATRLKLPPSVINGSPVVGLEEIRTDNAMFAVPKINEKCSLHVSDSRLMKNLT